MTFARLCWVESSNFHLELPVLTFIISLDPGFTVQPRPRKV